MPESNKSILYVDDNEDGREVLTAVFESSGFEVTACEKLEDCLEQARKKSFAAIIMDNHFDTGDSYAICHEIRTFNPSVPIIFYSGEAREDEIAKAFAAGATEYLVKPLGIIELPEVVEKLTKPNKYSA